MTRNYHRLWQRPHWPHRDSPYPDINPEPLHLYTHQNLPTFAPEFDPLSPAASESGDYGQWQDCEEWQDCEPENSDHFDPREPYYANNENSDHFDPREPPDNDYYNHSDGDYEPNYDYDEENFERQSSQHDYDDYEWYPDDTEALSYQFQMLDLGDGIIEMSHAAKKDVFYHHEAGQMYHIQCLDCMDYMNQKGFEIPPPGYDYKQHGTPW